MLGVWTRSDILMLRFMSMNALIDSGGRVRRLAWTASVAYSIVMSAAASPALQPTTGLTQRCLASSWSSHPAACRSRGHLPCFGPDLLRLEAMFHAYEPA